MSYIPLSTLKSMLRIADSVDDATLSACIDAASDTIDDICHRKFSLDTTATARVFYADSFDVVRVDDIGSTSGLIVKIDTDDNGTYDTIVTDYFTEPLNATSLERPITKLRSYNTTWPVGGIRPAVEVTAKWGWPVVPEPVKSATGILAGRLFKRADSLLGVAGFSDLGAITLRAVDPDVQRMLAPYVRPVIG